MKYEIVVNSQVLGAEKAICWDIKKTGFPTLQEVMAAANREFYEFSYTEVEVSVTSDDGSPMLILKPR